MKSKYITGGLAASIAVALLPMTASAKDNKKPPISDGDLAPMCDNDGGL